MGRSVPVADKGRADPDGSTRPLPRILAIMGSGETAPAMAKVHRLLFARLGSAGGPAVILDTPYGFQENAEALSARTVEFYATSVGQEVSVVSYRSSDLDPLEVSTAAARLRGAQYVMAGPGSPSYAVRTWIGGPAPGILADKLATGGIVTLASAAALALGAVTIPVYEIYKAGDAPAWIPGLDLLEPATGLRAAIVPHFDNAEGGNHDTRFCYMGERRLRILERSMPGGTFILGVDSHTALVLDLDARMATVHGLGTVTVRVDGRSTTFASGTEISIDELAASARSLVGGAHGTPHAAAVGHVDVPSRPAVVRAADVDLELAFLAAIDGHEMDAAVRALLELDERLAARLRSGGDSPDLDAASVAFRSMIVRLGEAAGHGGDSRATLDPLVSTLLDLRARARAARDWETADLVRARLTGAGVEVRDAQGASSWSLREPVAS